METYLSSCTRHQSHYKKSLYEYFNSFELEFLTLIKNLFSENVQNNAFTEIESNDEMRKTFDLWIAKKAFQQPSVKYDAVISSIWKKSNQYLNAILPNDLKDDEKKRQLEALAKEEVYRHKHLNFVVFTPRQAVVLKSAGQLILCADF